MSKKFDVTDEKFVGERRIGNDSESCKQTVGIPVAEEKRALLLECWMDGCESSRSQEQATSRAEAEAVAEWPAPRVGGPCSEVERRVHVSSRRDHTTRDGCQSEQAAQA